MKALIGLVICLSVGLTGLLAAPSARAEDLEQALRLGLASDPLLREADANRNAALEAKPDQWKLAFRAGKPATEAARAFAQRWLSDLQSQGVK